MKVRRIVKMNVSRCKVGDVIKYRLLNGEKHEAMAMKQDGDDIIFQQVDYMKNKYRMNPTNSNEFGWEETEFRNKLNGEVLALFPDKLRNNMVIFDDGDILTLVTEKEMFGRNKHGKNDGDEVTQWEPMKNRKNRISFCENERIREYSWLKTKAISTFYFVFVDYFGYSFGDVASSSVGVRPVFRIKNMSKSEKVSDEWLLEDEIPE